MSTVNIEKSIQVTLGRKNVKVSLEKIRETAKELNINLNTCDNTQRTQIINVLAKNSTNIVHQDKSSFQIENRSSSVSYSSKFEQAAIVKQQLSEYDVTATDMQIFDIVSKMPDNYMSELEMISVFLNELERVADAQIDDSIDKISNTIANIETKQLRAMYDTTNAIKAMAERRKSNTKKACKLIFDSMVVPQGEDFVKSYRAAYGDENGLLSFEV